MKRLFPASAFAFTLVVLITCNTRAQCDATKLGAFSERDTLIIDARPDQVNSFRGKTEFKREARIALVNMNPFVYSYRIKVKQQQIQDIGFLHFLKLLGSPVSDIATASPLELALFKSEAAAAATTSGNFDILMRRTITLPSVPASCEVDARSDVANAIRHLADIRSAALRRMGTITGMLSSLPGQYSGASAIYEAEKGNIYSETIDHKSLCESADRLYKGLTAARYPDAARLKNVQDDIAYLHSVIDELEVSATEYKNDALYKNCQARSQGMSYATSLINLAQEMRRLNNANAKKVEALFKETETYEFLTKAINKLHNKENELLQRQFNIVGEFDVSAANVRIFLDPPELATSSTQAAQSLSNRISPIGTSAMVRDNQGFPVVGNIQDTSQPAAANAQAEMPGAQFADATQASARQASTSNRSTTGVSRLVGSSRVITPLGTLESSQAEETPAKEPKKIEVNTTIGARRFELSGGMVFSSLPRREFKAVLGYARNEQGVIIDAEGNPTDKRELTSIVGVSENSKRRFAPMVLLHTRLTNNLKYNLFFSVGVTGKKDDAGMDLEYLIGPSVNFLNRNMFFTFGGYAGKQQRLAGDLFLNSRLPDGTSEIPIRKSYEWKPGFSFTYRFPLKNPTPEDK